jgi:hypothetical protein
MGMFLHQLLLHRPAGLQHLPRPGAELRGLSSVRPAQKCPGRVHQAALRWTRLLAMGANTTGAWWRHPGLQVQALCATDREGPLPR